MKLLHLQYPIRQILDKSTQMKNLDQDREKLWFFFFFLLFSVTYGSRSYGELGIC